MKQRTQLNRLTEVRSQAITQRNIIIDSGTSKNAVSELLYLKNVQKVPAISLELADEMKIMSTLMGKFDVDVCSEQITISSPYFVCGMNLNILSCLLLKTMEY